MLREYALKDLLLAETSVDVFLAILSTSCKSHSLACVGGGGTNRRLKDSNTYSDLTKLELERRLGTCR